jgi:inorganic pyrophosphatase
MEAQIEVPIKVDTPNSASVRIEMSAGSRNKYRVDPAGQLRLSRVVRGMPPCPANYGFVIDVLGADDKELDAFVLSDEAIEVAAVVPVRAVGVFRAVDHDEEDVKLVCVPLVDDHWASAATVDDLPGDVGVELREYVRWYKGYEIQVPEWEAVDKLPGRRVEHSWRSPEPSGPPAASEV